MPLEQMSKPSLAPLSEAARTHHLITKPICSQGKSKFREGDSNTESLPLFGYIVQELIKSAIHEVTVLARLITFSHSLFFLSFAAILALTLN